MSGVDCYSKEDTYKGVESLIGKKIATSYPNTAKGFLVEKGDAELHIINGSVEIAPNIGLADAVCDIVLAPPYLKTILKK